MLITASPWLVLYTQNCLVVIITYYNAICLIAAK